MNRRESPATEWKNGPATTGLRAPIRAVCFDWGGTLMLDDGPDDLPMAEWPRVAAVAGARECLSALHNRIPLCVATNAAASSRLDIERALDRVDLLPFISHIFCQKEIGHRKDSPQFWSAVERDLGIPLDHIAMVGDSLEHDVTAPLHCGLQAVWFNQDGRQTASSSSAPMVTDLEEFAGLVLIAIRAPS